MRGYLSVVGTDSGDIAVDSRVQIYRNPENNHAVLARTKEGEHDLGVRDVTVSRIKDGTPAVVIDPRQSRIEVHNKRNSNGVTVVSNGDRTELEKGLTATVDDSATITIGYQAEFHLTIEREAQTEINVEGSVDGDVVAGDQKQVDKRTEVVDSVVNRSDIGGDGGSEVDDSVVNRSSVGTSSQEEQPDEGDTRKHCETHERMYTSEECPECKQERQLRAEKQSETKYCLYCGTAIPAVAVVCPDCGKQLPESS